jgi:hypothetical protein
MPACSASLEKSGGRTQKFAACRGISTGNAVRTIPATITQMAGRRRVAGTGCAHCARSRPNGGLLRCITTRRTCVSRRAGRDTNFLLGRVRTWRDDGVSPKALQKRYGRSISVRAPGHFTSELTRKAERASGQRQIIDVRRLKTIQYDHTADTFTPDPLRCAPVPQQGTSLRSRGGCQCDLHAGGAPIGCVRRQVIRLTFPCALLLAWSVPIFTELIARCRVLSAADRTPTNHLLLPRQFGDDYFFCFRCWSNQAIVLDETVGSNSS